MAVAFAELWETLKQAIAAYTGLSPAAFFTAVAVAAALYHVVSGIFAAPPPPPRRPREEPEAEPLPPPVQLGEVTEEELRQYDGSDPKKPLLMAIKGQIYDVTQSRMFYGPGGPYALFAGKDASRALAKMSFEPQDLTGDISGLGPFEVDALQDWEYKFMSKYVKVGTIKTTVPIEDGTTSTSPETTETAAEAQSEKAPATDDKPREASPETTETAAEAQSEKAPATDDKPREASSEEVKEKEAAAADQAGAKESSKTAAEAQSEKAPATDDKPREASSEEVKEKEAAAADQAGAKES